MSIETIERTFTVEGPAKLKVTNISGRVTIRPGQDGIIQVTATKHTDKGNPEKTNIEIEQAEDGSVAVITHYDSAGWSFKTRPCVVDYEIVVPQQCSLKASNVSSNLSARGLSGTFRLKSVSGLLELEQLKGEMDLTSVSGKILARDLSGDLKFENVSGKIEISNSEIPTVIGKSVSGDFKMESALGEGPYTFKSVSGRVTLLVPGDTRATLSQSGISGSIKTNLPVTSRQRMKGAEKVEVQQGGTAISLNSVSGSVHLLSPDIPENLPTDQMEKPSDSPRPQTGPSQLQILEALERGEMSVEEALEKMNA